MCWLHSGHVTSILPAVVLERAMLPSNPVFLCINVVGQGCHGQAHHEPGRLQRSGMLSSPPLQ